MRKEKNNPLTIKIIKDKIKTYIPSPYKIKKWANLSFNKRKKAVVIIKLASSDEIMKINNFEGFWNDLKKAMDMFGFLALSTDLKIFLWNRDYYIYIHLKQKKVY